MKNIEAADVLREYIRTNKPCNGLELALQKAITALEHAPDTLHNDKPDAQQCVNCGTVWGILSATCPSCGSNELRPIYDKMSEIGRKA